MDTAITIRPSLTEIGIAWLSFGIQSFGGGSSTFYLIHRACVDRGWLDEEEFVRAWALSQIAPGVNLIKLTAMIAYELRGWPGLIVALIGLLLPSGAVTALMTAGFATIHDVPAVQAILKGVLPATIGLSIANGVQMAQPLFSRAYQEGRTRLGAHIFVLLGGAALFVLTSISPVVILFLTGAAAILVFGLLPTATVQPAEDRSAQ